jgi:hypothetical protein
MKTNNVKKHAFGFDLSALETYTDQTGGLLLAEAVTKGKTAELCYVQSGVKGSQAINLLTSTLNVQDGSCGWNSSGSTTFTQRNITVCDKKVNEALCPRDLNNYWASAFLNAGSYNEQVPFEEAIAQLKVDQIAEYVENELWRATTGTSCFDGFATLISTGTTGVIAVTGATGITASNALAEVDKLIELIPNEVADRSDLIVWMSMANYRKYLINLRTANYFHFAPDAAEFPEYVTMHPGTNVRVAGTSGINTDGVYLGPAEYMVVGVDLLSDEERLDIFYSRDNDEVRVRSNFKIGAQIAFPEYFVTNNLA